jgi:aarF domain-containing kinase
VAWLFPEFQFIWLAEETKKNLPLELDFVHEAKNCERVAKMFNHFPFLKVRLFSHQPFYWNNDSFLGSCYSLGPYDGKSSHDGILSRWASE